MNERYRNSYIAIGLIIGFAVGVLLSWYLEDTKVMAVIEACEADLPRNVNCKIIGVPIED